MRRVAAAALPFALLLGGGCTLLSGVDSLTETDGGPSSDAAGDVAAEATSTADGLTPDGRPLDSPGDTLPGDTLPGEASPRDASPRDAAVDVAFDAGIDAPTGPFCVTGAHTFCADFDESTLTVGWTFTSVDEGGTASQDPASFQSPPFSFLSTVQAGFSSHEARLYKDLGQQATAIHVAFDLRVEQVGQDCHGLRFNLSSGTYFIFSLSLPAAVYEEGPTSDGGSYSFTYALEAGAALSPQWVHVTADLAIGSPTTVSVAFDGNSVLTQQPVSSFFANGTLEIGLGANSQSNMGCQLRYDNLTVDLQ